MTCDPLAPAKGIVTGILICLVFWAIVACIWSVLA
jgi:hypothetical protein